ncbi:MAG: PadR family transcriptional regulator [Oscillospiraceae bacterium]|nr:PadR family transcriptional regulator [Oscillospiraceae bacterium]
MDTQLKRGVLEICVLSAMRKEDAYGYKIIKDLSPFMEVSESTLYPILKRLEQSGCVTVYSIEHNGRLRKYYRITETGHERIGEFLSDWDSVMRAYRFIKGEKNNDEN